MDISESNNNAMQTSSPTISSAPAVPSYHSIEVQENALLHFNELFFSFLHNLQSNIDQLSFKSEEDKRSFITTVTSLRNILFLNRNSRIGVTAMMESFFGNLKLVLAQNEYQPIAYPVFQVHIQSVSPTNNISNEIIRFLKTNMETAIILYHITTFKSNYSIELCKFIDSMLDEFVENKYPVEFVNLLRDEGRKHLPPVVHAVLKQIIKQAENFKPTFSTVANHIANHPESRKEILNSLFHQVLPTEAGIMNMWNGPPASADKFTDAELRQCEEELLRPTTDIELQRVQTIYNGFSPEQKKAFLVQNLQLKINSTAGAIKK